ncbi:Rhomboid protease AarA [Bacteroidales bacterium Barb6XT]|nr:Rhomboid protease AarA [Bacteroidales bacterium Barb6XT]
MLTFAAINTDCMNYANNSGFLDSIPPVTKNLLFINFLFWVASLALPKAGIDLTNLLGLHFPGAKDFHVFQFVSYMFMHDTHTFSHVLFNMFAVFMFGRVIESVWGAKRFIIFYLVTGIGAAVVQELTWLQYIYSFASSNGTTIGEIIAYDPTLNQMITVGASGAVFGILLAFGMMFPNADIYIMFIPVPVKAKYAVVGYGVIELFLGVSGFAGDVAHFAHLGGMLFGYIMIRYWRTGKPHRQ